MMKPDSIILDIDGTLWDSTSVVADAWNEALSGRRDIKTRFTPQMLTQLFGRPLTDIADLSFPDLEKEDRYALIDICCEHEEEALRLCDKDLLYPGVADTVRALSKDYRLFIVSNCQDGYIELFLEKTGLGPFIADFECPGRTGLGKGRNIRLVAERNGLKAPVYVGDIERDHQAALEAGIPFCHASYGFGKADRPDYVIRCFSELLSIF